jgi:hypothetical protein
MRALTPDDKRSLQAILDQEESMKTHKAEYTESIKAVAERLAVTPADLRKILTMAKKERAKIGAIDADRALLDLAAEIV